ncbi:MAG: peroxiredoxin [Candidatus Azotimanducaceae bacterium]
MQLESVKQMLAPLGVKVAAMTYDAVETNARFQARHKVTYPLLSDIDARHVMAFGILNEQYAPGHRFYGIAHPGMMLVSPEGKIVARFAEANFRQRPDYDEVVAAVGTWLDAQPDPSSEPTRTKTTHTDTTHTDH